ncbi:TetR/AcrR family transcriptional regulator [Streptomyces sp. NPDC004129]
MTQREASENQIRIMDAAAEEFMRAGFDAASIDDIARRIGQTKGFIYYNFRSKVEIFFAVYERGMEMVRDEVTPFADGPGNALERLHRMARAHLVNLMDTVAYHDVIHQGIEQRLRMRLTESQRETLIGLNSLRDEYEALFRAVIEEGVAEGSIRPLPVAVAARTLLGGLNAVDIWYRKEKDHEAASVEELASQVSDVLVSGFHHKS